MSQAPPSREGVTLRRAALIAGLCMLIGVGVPIAESVLRPRLIVPGNIEETVRRISTEQGLVVTFIFAYFVAFVADVVIAWALYVLLAPVSRELSMLTSWFRLVYAVIALGALLNLANVYRMLHGPQDPAHSAEQLNAQVLSLVNAFSWEWGLGLVVFGVHLVLLGYLVYRSEYIPRPVGAALVVAGLGYCIYYLQPYLYPGRDLPFIFLAFTGLGELVFLLWLLLRGWRIREPTPTPTQKATEHPT